MAGLLTVEEAQQLVLERVRRLDAERVPIERAFGRVLAEPATATCDLPPFPSSAMDGYAVRSEDLRGTPARLSLVERIAAGSPAGARLGAGEAMAISTGGVVPDGADAVVPLERAVERDGTVEIVEAVAPGVHVRDRAGDVGCGETILGPGAFLGAAQVGALAAAGVSEVRCTKRPRVGILVTGSELRKPGESLGPGQIYESNGLMLAAQLGAAGAVPAQLGAVADDPDEHRTAMERALLGFDMLVTTGGASVGPHDLVRAVQRELRVEEVFWGVAVRPGRPTGFGMRRDHPVFNLPGNPVSALVCFELFVRPAVNALVGLPEPLPALRRGVLERAVARHPEREDFVRARSRLADGVVRLEPLSGQESHMIVSAATADALVRVPRGEGELAAGDDASYLVLA